MKQLEYIRKIDIEIDREYINYTSVRQNDSARAILFHLHANGTDYPLANRSVRAWGVKPDGTKVFIDLEIVSTTEGKCKLRLTNNILAKVGELRLMLTIVEGDDILSTSPISIDIKESLKDDEAVESTNEFTALENSLKSVKEWDKYFEETSGNIEEKYTDRLNKIDKRLTRKLKATFNLAEWWVMGSNVDSYLPRDNAYITKDLELFKSMGVDGISLCVYGAYGKDKSVSSATDSWYMIHKLDTVKHACSECKRLGLNIEHLKFMLHDSTTKANVIKKIDTFKPFWKNIIDTYCSALFEEGYKLSVVTCFNELATIYSSTTYKDFVLEVLEIPKKYEYKASISCLNIGEIIVMDKDITDKLDVFCSNIYPKGSYNGASATVEEQVQCWDRQVTLVKALKEEYPSKEIYITETGLRDTWEALANPGDYNLTGTGYTTTYGEVSALFLRGLFESEMMNHVASVTYWYFDSLFGATTRKMFEPIKKLFTEYMGVVYDE